MLLLLSSRKQFECVDLLANGALDTRTSLMFLNEIGYDRNPVFTSS